MIFTLTYVISVKRNGIKYIDSVVIHKKKPDRVNPSLAVLLVGVAGFEPTTFLTSVRIRYLEIHSLLVFKPLQVSSAAHIFDLTLLSDSRRSIFEIF